MRKTETVTITAEGRDKGKRFLLTEMPAFKAERWAYRALLALAHAGVEMPEDAQAGGMQSLALVGIKALNNLDFNETRPLLDEMFTCVQVLPDPKNPEIVRPLLIADDEGDDIEEITTILMLRERIFRLHTDFFFKGKK